MSTHPSRLELDRASVRAGSAATAEHMGSCAECAAYVARIKEAPPLPGWVHALPPRKRRSLFAWLKLPALAGGMALAGAAAALLIVARPSSYVGEKGSPAVAVYLKRDGTIFLWDGSARVRQGDQLQLQLDPQTFRHVAVAQIGSDGTRPLWASALSQVTMVPTSWTLDDAPGAETLVVVFSGAGLSSEQLSQAARELPRTQALWTVRLVLEKEARR